MPDPQKSNPMAPFVDVIHEVWWQGKKPPPPPRAEIGHHIGRDLSVVKAWLKRGYSREVLLCALKRWDGNPNTLLVFHKRGNNNLINKLIGEHRKAQEMQGTRVGSILKELAEKG